MIVISLASFLLLSVASASDVPAYEEVPANYQFQWGVLDSYTGNDFGQEEARSGYNTDGEYRVLLPDGRYEGEAKYAPEPAYNPAPYKAPAPKPVYQPKPAPSYNRPAYVAPEPAYKPAPKPAYKPAPAPAYKPAPAPAYKAPEPAYKPAPKPVYKPVPEPAYQPAPAYKAEPVYTTPKPVYRPRPTYAPLVAAASTLAPQYYKSPDGSAPTYNAGKVVKRRMQLRHRNALPVATAKAGVGSIFRGDTKNIKKV